MGVLLAFAVASTGFVSTAILGGCAIDLRRPLLLPISSQLVLSERLVVMNEQMQTEQKDKIVDLILTALVSLDEIPTQITVKFKDNKYFCEISHPTDWEPKIN